MIGSIGSIGSMGSGHRHSVLINAMMVLPVIDSAEKTPSSLKAEVQWKGSWRIRAANATLCVVASPGRLAGGA